MTADGVDTQRPCLQGCAREEGRRSGQEGSRQEGPGQEGRRPAKRAAAKKVPAKKAPAKKAAAVKKAPAVEKAPAKKAAAKKAAPAKKAPAKKAAAKRKAPATKARSPFSAAFLKAQWAALLEERATYVRQAESLRAEAESLVADIEPGDVQFDEESGEGDTLAVERERDLALSAQARQAVEEIDHAAGQVRPRHLRRLRGLGRARSPTSGSRPSRGPASGSSTRSAGWAVAD